MNEAAKRPAVWWEAGESGALPERGRLVVDAGEMTIGIFRVDGALRAYENRCAHMGGPVCQGLIVSRVEEVLDGSRALTGSRFDHDRPQIACPWHGAEYDLRTGEHAGADGLMRLRSIPVKEEEGRIYVLA